MVLPGVPLTSEFVFEGPTVAPPPRSGRAVGEREWR